TVPSRYGSNFFSTTSFTPWTSATRSFSLVAVSNPRLYENPLHPPPCTPTRSTVPSGRFCSVIIFLTSFAAFSVSVTPMRASPFDRFPPPKLSGEFDLVKQSYQVVKSCAIVTGPGNTQSAQSPDGRRHRVHGKVD